MPVAFCESPPPTVAQFPGERAEVGHPHACAQERSPKVCPAGASLETDIAVSGVDLKYPVEPCVVEHHGVWPYRYMALGVGHAAATGVDRKAFH